MMITLLSLTALVLKAFNSIGVMLSNIIYGLYLPYNFQSATFNTQSSKRSKEDEIRVIFLN